MRDGVRFGCCRSHARAVFCMLLTRRTSHARIFSTMGRATARHVANVPREHEAYITAHGGEPGTRWMLRCAGGEVQGSAA